MNDNITPYTITDPEIEDKIYDQQAELIAAQISDYGVVEQLIANNTHIFIDEATFEIILITELPGEFGHQDIEARYTIDGDRS